MRPYLRLCRIPNVFTAMANVFAGVVLARGGSFEQRDLLLVGSSACSYCAGMVLNDYFDRTIDAVERPERPIPAGEVSVRSALSLGCGLATAGLLLAVLHGPTAGLFAAGLLAMILAYDAWAKATLAGPVVMGACRGLNVMLGLTVVTWKTPWIAVAALGMGFYTVAITVLSRSEVGGAGVHGTRPVVGALAALACFVAAGSLLAGPADARTVAWWAPFFALLAVRGAMVFGPLWRDASGPALGRAIGGGILLMPALDASVLAASGLVVSAMACLVIGTPAYVLRRWYYVT